jgi:O-succinylbenzoic acid--CoA ligase
MSIYKPWIAFDDERIWLDEIPTKIVAGSIDVFQRTVLVFCQEWLAGKEHFELQTSGSTGAPKLVNVSRNQLKASAQLTANALGLQRNFTALVCLDTRYIAGIMMLIRSLEVGMNMIIVAPSSHPLDKISFDDSIDFTAFVPLQLETILKSSQKEKLNQIKIALIGGAALNLKTVSELNAFTCQFFATYGMTETVSHIALQRLNGAHAQDFFEVLPGITLNQDQRDCLVIQAPHIQHEPIVTNDLVELINPSQFRWLGRADTVINTGGIKVIPEKIESSILSIFEELKITNRFFVAAMADDRLGESVNLFIEGNPLSQHIEEIIHEKLSVWLPKFERPKSIYYLAQFLITDTGKINKPKSISLMQSS